MAKFGQMLLNRGAYGKWSFFGEKTFETMLPRRLEKLLGRHTKKVFGFGLDGQPERFGHGAASGATFHVDVKRELVVIMTRNRYGKNQDKYNGAFWKAIDEGIEAQRK
jgi:CubicO group peptidase (beta-lactamase class C family)